MGLLDFIIGLFVGSATSASKKRDNTRTTDNRHTYNRTDRECDCTHDYCDHDDVYGDDCDPYDHLDREDEYDYHEGNNGMYEGDDEY